jgi:hypothetical protein
MTGTAQTLTFLAWARPPIGGLVTGQAGGRAQAGTSITLTESGADGSPGRTQTQPVSFLVAGPADVTGLQPGAIVRRYPAPGAADHESDRCPYVELADPTLPWRYTPAPTPASANLHPWLVLVVGQEGTELVIAGDQVTIEVSAQQDTQALGDPSSAYRFAHVQQDAAGHRVTRILGGRPLEAGTDYLAVVVPAYDTSGARSWTGAAAVTVPLYDHWRFHTAVPAGSFEDLAAQLRPGDAPASTGRAPLHYPRLAGAPMLSVPGALVAPPGSGGPVTEDPLPADVQADLGALRLPARDPQGRPIVTLPRYGEAWDAAAADQSQWARDLNLDPRHRGIAGLGLQTGIDAQEDLVADVLASLGALQEARQRIRHLTLGLAASRSLWQRRVPADPPARLWLLGPAVNRLVTSDGTVGDLATAADRTIAPGTFSAAARRVLRAGPARTTLAAADLTPATLITSANRQPPPPPASIDGIPLDDTGLRVLDTASAQVIRSGHVNTGTLLAAATELAAGSNPAVRPVATQLVTAMRQASQAGKAVPWGPAMAMLAAGDATVAGQGRDPATTLNVLSRNMSALRDRFADQADDADLTQMLAALRPLPPGDPALSPVSAEALAAGVTAAFDPSADDAPAAARVLATIGGGIDPAQPLAPPELSVQLDRPAWADLAAAGAQWLLPGVGQLPANSVIALQSDPIFIDGYLTGLNTQLLGELRWRNIPVATGCTPIRRFWDRADTTTGEPADDITGITSWTASGGLGDQTHLAPGATGQELVIAVRGELLLRYPTTLVYLQPAVPPGATTADFDADPDPSAAPVLPAFRGRIGADVVFFGFPAVDSTALASHWLVFEEPPAGYRFANDVPTSASAGHEWAAAALAEPVRVLIRGDSLRIGTSA